MIHFKSIFQCEVFKSLAYILVEVRHKEVGSGLVNLKELFQAPQKGGGIFVGVENVADHLDLDRGEYRNDRELVGQLGTHSAGAPRGVHTDHLWIFSVEALHFF